MLTNAVTLLSRRFVFGGLFYSFSSRNYFESICNYVANRFVSGYDPLIVNMQLSCILTSLLIIYSGSKHVFNIAAALNASPHISGEHACQPNHNTRIPDYR